MTTSLTPMMRQYLQIKEQHKDSILFFRLGDFYEMFFDDAVEASRILHIALTARDAGKGNKVPMCGIPYHAADNYIARLIKQGKKVAICEQMEEPAPGKKLVEREITKIITPGTLIADELLEGAVNNYILSLHPYEGGYGLAYADISTGEFRVTEIDGTEDLYSELYKISPSEYLVPEDLAADKRFLDIKKMSLGVVTARPAWYFDNPLAEKELKEHFGVRDLSGFGCQGLRHSISAAGALVRYLKDTQRTALSNIRTIATYNISQFMTLDWNSQRNLELIENMEDLSSSGTLLGVLDKTGSPMGKRRLKRWILNPLMRVDEIIKRQDAVDFFFAGAVKRDRARNILSRISDIERLANKVSLGSANARDMVNLSLSLKNVKDLRGAMSGDMPELLREETDSLDVFDDVISWIDGTLVDEPPIAVKDGGIVREGYDEELDKLRAMTNTGREWLQHLQKREIERTGINSLKIGYNRVFGYYIEITNSNLASAPADYIRKQTLTGAERFTTRELEEYESKILGADDRAKGLEYDILCELRRKVGQEIVRLKAAADTVAELDVITSLAEVAVRNKFVRPEVDGSCALNIIDGRHPVLETLLKDKEFVPNDTSLGGDEGDIFIITGSNMAGKSTFMRQVALIAIMAQIGSFVPAKEARIGVFDRVFTRVGASDRLHKGMSTFMVEMLETANILNNATGKSLIILDEIGRGTSTYDGVSIAWAVVEYIHDKIPGAKTLFATHFHELTELAETLKGFRNYHLSIKEWKDDIIFLYKVAEGSCDESFGIHVAKLAGVPGAVVSRAREILNNLQKDSMSGGITTKFINDRPGKEKQFELFAKNMEEDEVIAFLKNADVNNMTPVEALSKLLEIQKKLGGPRK